MKRPNELKGVWAFLEDSGVLENGSPDEIESARRLYWKEYFRQNKRKQRKHKPEVSVRFTNNESLDEMKVAAKKHEQSLSTFIRDSSLSYIKQEFVNPKEEQWEQIQQALYLAELRIKQISEEDEEAGSFHRNYNFLLEQLMTLEQTIENALNAGHILEDAIRSAVQQKPWRKATLINLIEGL